MPAAIRLQAVSENTSGYEFNVVVSGLDQNAQSMPYSNYVTVSKGAQTLISGTETISTQAAMPPGPPSIAPQNETDDSVELAVATGSPNEKISLLYAPAGSDNFDIMGGLMTGNLTIPDLTPGTTYTFIAFIQTSGGTSPVVTVTTSTTGIAPVAAPPTPPVVPTTTP